MHRKRGRLFRQAPAVFCSVVFFLIVVVFAVVVVLFLVTAVVLVFFRIPEFQHICYLKLESWNSAYGISRTFSPCKRPVILHYNSRNCHRIISTIIYSFNNHFVQADNPVFRIALSFIPGSTTHSRYGISLAFAGLPHTNEHLCDHVVITILLTSALLSPRPG